MSVIQLPECSLSTTSYAHASDHTKQMPTTVTPGLRPQEAETLKVILSHTEPEASLGCLSRLWTLS